MNTPRDLAIPLQRITWRDGQMVTSADLRDDQAGVDRLRHLHVRYQHKTWGVVEGLNVTAAGATSVVVGPGYALDIEGCELLVPTGTTIAVPGIAARTTMYLVISRYAASTGCASLPDLATLCPGVTPLPIEAGRLSWKTVSEVRPGDDVLLARALIANGRLGDRPDTSVQRLAAAAQPLIWSDVTLAGQTGWKDVADRAVPSVTAAVNTSDAGLVAVPAYFARLAGTSQTATGFISSATATGFTFVVRFGGVLAAGMADTVKDAASAENAGWTIAWLAVELQKGQSL